MSISSALVSAVSGLTASARGTETVAANLSNMTTPGYGRREMIVSSTRLGGTQVEGVNRVVNLTLLAEVRSATAAQGEAQTRASHLQAMEQLVGIPGEPGSLGSALSELGAALTSAAARPDDSARLATVVRSASTLAGRINAVADGVQAARLGADRQIARDVGALNAGLDRVAELNRQITTLKSGGNEVSALEDERQAVVDRLAAIVPLQQVARDDGKIALFATAGALLLDGTKPIAIGFQPTPAITAEMTLASGALAQLTYDGQPMTQDRAVLFAGGTLAANFAIRDELAPGLQREIDAIALDLHDRFADPAVDPTLAGQPGLFSDPAGPAGVGTITGLASRITVNPLVVPASGGELWRLRSGIGAAAAGPVGDSSTLLRMGDVLSATRSMADFATFGGSSSLENFAGQLISRISTQRVGADSELAVTAARSGTLTQRLQADGVDSDDEMRRLLQYEQAYAANAKVIQTIDEMLNTLLRI